MVPNTRQTVHCPDAGSQNGNISQHRNILFRCFLATHHCTSSWSLAASKCQNGNNCQLAPSRLSMTSQLIEGTPRSFPPVCRVTATCRQPTLSAVSAHQPTNDLESLGSKCPSACSMASASSGINANQRSPLPAPPQLCMAAAVIQEPGASKLESSAPQDYKYKL